MQQGLGGGAWTGLRGPQFTHTLAMNMQMVRRLPQRARCTPAPRLWMDGHCPFLPASIQASLDCARIHLFCFQTNSLSNRELFSTEGHWPLDKLSGRTQQGVLIRGERENVPFAFKK